MKADRDQRENEVRRSKGNGTKEDPFTPNPDYVNAGKQGVIREAACLSIDRAMDGEPIYFRFEKGPFLISKLTPDEPIFGAKYVNPRTSRNANFDDLSIATSIFTLQAFNRAFERVKKITSH